MTKKNTIKEMSFLDHLEELRWRLLYSIIGIIAGAIISWIFIDFLIEQILLAPAKSSAIPLQNLKPFGQLFLYFQVALIVGFIISIPNIFYQLWKFIAPALKKNEQKYIKWIVLYSAFCFLSGIAFAYFLMLPVTLKFAAQFGTELIENKIAISEYMSIVFSVLIASAIIFELPMLSFFLSKLGILKPSLMRKFRRHSIIVIFIFAAILSPGTDPVAQVMLGIPLVILYEISILVSKLSQRKG